MKQRARIVSMVAGATAVSLFASAAHATDWQSYNGAAGPYNYSSGANWVGGVAPQNDLVTPTPATANLSSAPITNANLAVTLDVPVNLYQLTFGDAGNTFNTNFGNGATNALSFQTAGGANGDLGVFSMGTLGSVTNTISAPIVMPEAWTYRTESTNHLTLSGTLSSTGGNRELRNRANTGQTLTVNGNVQLWDPLVDDGAGVQLAREVWISGNNGSVTVINGNLVEGNGTTQQSTGAVRFRSSSTSAGTTPTFRLMSDNSTTFTSGDIYVDEATLILGHDNALGGARLRMGNGNNARFLGQIQAESDTTVINGGLFQQGGNTVISGEHSLTINGDIFQSNNRIFSNVLPAGKTVTMNGTLSIFNTESGRTWTQDGSGETIINSIVRDNNIDPPTDIGPNNFAKRGTGTVTFNGANTYTGATNVIGGLLVYNNAASIGSNLVTAIVTVGPSGAIAYGPGLADAGFATLAAKVDPTSVGALAIDAADAASNVTFSGNMAGMSLGSEADTLNFTGTITPGNNKYRIGGGRGMIPTITLAGANQLSGAGNSAEYANGGTIVVNSAQSYGGGTAITSAVSRTDELRAATRGTNSAQNIFVPTVLSVNSIANGGVNSPLGASSNAAANLVLNGGTLRYTGAAGSTDRLFTIGLDQVGLTAAALSTRSGGTIESSGSGPLSFTNTGNIGVDETAGAIARTLTVGGTNTGANTIAGNIGNGLGSSVVSVAKTGAGTWNLTGNLTYSGSTNVSGGKLAVASSLTNASVTVGAGSVLQVASGGGSNRVVRTPALTVNGKLDLTDNKLIVTTPAQTGTWTGTAYDGISGLVDSGRGSAGNALWDGASGIVTSDTRAINNGDLVSIGVAKVSDVRPITDTDTTTFAGQTVLGTDTLAMVTWGGDANLDGKINIDDYGRIDGNVGQSGSVFGWSKGDFNYDGKINIDDYGIIDGNINRQGAAFPTSSGAGAGAVAGAGALEGVAAVPEPASLSLVALGAMGLMRRRRRGSNDESLGARTH